MRGWWFLAGGFAAVSLDVLYPFAEPSQLAFQGVDFVPLPNDGFVEFLDRLVLMAQPDFEFFEAGFRCVGRFFGHGVASLGPVLPASSLFAAGVSLFT